MPSTIWRWATPNRISKGGALDYVEKNSLDLELRARSAAE
jgi:hypothetical protein